MPNVPRVPRILSLLLAAGPLLPGALAAQQPSAVSLPTLDDVHRVTPTVRMARHGPVGPLHHARLRALRMSDVALRGGAGPDLGARSPALTRVATAEPPSVLDAVFALTGPAKERKEDDEGAGLGSLGDVLPKALTRDLLELRTRIRQYRTVLFGQRGIVRWGTVDGDDRRGRIRLNLQADPDPGLRVTLITR